MSNCRADHRRSALRDDRRQRQLAASDWGGVVTRRAVKAPPDQGGWNMFITWAGGSAVGNPIALAGHAANGEKGWFGWPTDAMHEKLRDKWAARRTLAGAEGDRARDAEERLGFRAARLARAMGCTRRPGART